MICLDVPDGTQMVLAAGGVSTGGNQVKTMEVYNVGANTWTPLTQLLPLALAGFPGCVANNRYHSILIRKTISNIGSLTYVRTLISKKKAFYK